MELGCHIGNAAPLASLRACIRASSRPRTLLYLDGEVMLRREGIPSTEGKSWIGVRLRRGLPGLA